jgi:hypothetical protein
MKEQRRGSWQHRFPIAARPGFTVLICIPCLEICLYQPDTLLGLHDPGQPWEKWGCPGGRRYWIEA